MGSIRGGVVDAAGASVGAAAVQLWSPGGASSPVTAKADAAGSFLIRDVPPGLHVLMAQSPGFYELQQPVVIAGETAVDLGFVKLTVVPEGDIVCAVPCKIPSPPSIPVLTVCEALDQRDSLDHRPAVIVGVFKSGMDETLRLDCPFELTSGEIGWPASIGLTHTAQPPDQFRDPIEKKRQEILKSAPPEAPLRPERVIGLYGRFVSLAGLSKAKCCTSAVETVYPPARLFGLTGTDLRVIR